MHSANLTTQIIIYQRLKGQQVAITEVNCFEISLNHLDDQQTVNQIYCFGSVQLRSGTE